MSTLFALALLLFGRTATDFSRNLDEDEAKTILREGKYSANPETDTEKLLKFGLRKED